MQIKVCSSLIHPREISFPSNSKPGVFHTVITPTILNDEFCTCRGWQFRETCSHVETVLSRYCGWSTTDIEYTGVCPNCGEQVENFETKAEIL